MHKVFGIKENEKYVDRYGAYIIPIKNGKVGVIKTSKGLFFIGGGSEHDETDEQCIVRECLEEVGLSCNIKEKICSAETFCLHPEIGYFHPIQTYYAGDLLDKVRQPYEEDHTFVWIEYEKIKGKMHLDMQNWAIEQLTFPEKR